MKDPIEILEIDLHVEPTKCSKGHSTLYSAKWDARLCKECNEWTETRCDSTYPECAFDCANRPRRPLGDFEPYPGG